MFSPVDCAGCGDGETLNEEICEMVDCAIKNKKNLVLETRNKNQVYMFIY